MPLDSSAFDASLDITLVCWGCIQSIAASSRLADAFRITPAHNMQSRGCACFVVGFVRTIFGQGVIITRRCKSDVCVASSFTIEAENLR
mmetsp:Transcript_3118/g.5133  ORF Transcript_3118/g.5133 Transcript_3118/m.5133 type:complete len:89 (-) Transcript_3118:27-293(-)